MLTVLMATRNGSRTLPLVLEAFTRLHAPRAGWKLVVVDNGSTDRTRDILASFESTLPLTCIHERTRGKNAALNAGLAHVEGDLVVFTDDDAVPHPDWLVRLEAAARANPSYAMFGGVIVPRWEAPPPEWLHWLDLGHLFSVSDPRLNEGPTKPETLFGPNMAIRAERFLGGTRFDTSIGPRGPDYAMGSETELVQRLGGQGHKAWHVQTAIVEHVVRREQMNRTWVSGRAVRFGRGMYRLQNIAASEAFGPWALRLCLKMLRRQWWLVRARLASDQRTAVTARWDLHYFRGQVIEARRGRRRQVGTWTSGRSPS